eukprot:scaffold359842_cov24-Attheya_sp.AAC.1
MSLSVVPEVSGIFAAKSLLIGAGRTSRGVARRESSSTLEIFVQHYHKGWSSRIPLFFDAGSGD